MTRRIATPSKDVQLKLVGARDALKIPRVQRVTMNTDKASTDVDELGNRLHAGTSEDIPAVTVTFQGFDVGVKLFSILTGNDYNNYPASGVSINEIQDLDAIIQVKGDKVEDYVKMAHARRCVVRDFTFSYSVEGESTEEWTIIGGTKRWFRNDVVVEKFTTGTTSFVLSETPVQLKNGNYILSAILDGVYLDEVAGAPGTGEFSIAGSTITTSDSRTSQLLVVYQANPAGNNWDDIADATMPAVIRGQDVPIKLAANGIERVQSVTINGTFNPQAVREMGNRNVVGYQTQIVSITGSVSVLDTDLELTALFTTGDMNSSDTEFGVDELTASGISLQIILQDPEDTVAPYAVLKTVYLPEISISSEGYTSNVNQNAQQTYDFRSRDGELIVYSGAMP